MDLEIDELNDMLPFDLFDPMFLDCGKCCRMIPRHDNEQVFTFSVNLSFPQPSSMELAEAMRECIPPLDMGPEPCPVALAEATKLIENDDLVELNDYELKELLPIEGMDYSTPNFYGESSNDGGFDFNPGLPGFSTSSPKHQDQEMSHSLVLNHEKPLEKLLKDINAQLPEEPSSRTNEKNFLLIKVPQHLSEAAAFNSLPSVPLDPAVISQITQVSAGNDGVFLPRVDPASCEEIVRRPPLQIIKQSVFKKKIQPPIKPAISCKRKQKFNLTREDGIIFSDGTKTPEPLQHPPLLDDSFEWAESAIEPSEKAPAVEKPKRRPGFKKDVKIPSKNLNIHKRKMLKPAEVLKPFHTDFKCDYCNRCFRKKTYAKHLKLCAIRTNLMFCDSCGIGFRSKPGLRKHCIKCVPSQISVHERSAVSSPEVQVQSLSQEIVELDISDDTPVKRTTRSATKQQA